MIKTTEHITCDECGATISNDPSERHKYTSTDCGDNHHFECVKIFRHIDGQGDRLLDLCSTCQYKLLKAAVKELE